MRILRDVACVAVIILVIGVMKGMASKASGHDALTHMLHRKNRASRLTDELIRGYNPAVRPVKDPSRAMNISVDLALHQLEVNERTEVIKVIVWMRWRWRDEFLQWNDTEHCMKYLTIKAKEIWIPDLTLYDSVAFDQRAKDSHYLVTVASDGSIVWLFPAYFEIMCRMDVTHFPFDTQKCRLKFGSWGYSQPLLEVDAFNTTADISEYMDNGEWELIDVPMERNVSMYECCKDPFSHLNVWIVLKRRPWHYVWNIIGPSVLITCINLFTFLLPVESGEKVSLSVTSLLSMVVFLLMVAEHMPAQSEVVPILGQYFGISLVILTCSTLLSIFIIHLHFRGKRGEHVPSWLLHMVLRYLAPFLCYSDMIRNTRKSNRKRKIQEIVRKTAETSSVFNKDKRNSDSMDSQMNLRRWSRLSFRDTQSFSDLGRIISGSEAGTSGTRLCTTIPEQTEVTPAWAKRKGNTSLPITTKPKLEQISEQEPNIDTADTVFYLDTCDGDPAEETLKYNDWPSKDSSNAEYKTHDSPAMIKQEAETQEEALWLYTGEEREFSPDQEWSIVSIVLDRMLFFLCAFATALTTGYIVYWLIESR